MLALCSLRLPLAFTVLLVLVDLAPLLVLLGTAQGRETLLQAGGYTVFAFAPVRAFLFYNSFSLATGGREVPMGPAVLKSVKVLKGLSYTTGPSTCTEAGRMSCTVVASERSTAGSTHTGLNTQTPTVDPTGRRTRQPWPMCWSDLPLAIGYR